MDGDQLFVSAPLPYPGQKWVVEPEVGVMEKKHIDSWKECSDLCRQNVNCTFWDYQSSYSRKPAVHVNAYTCRMFSSVHRLSDSKVGAIAGSVKHGLPGNKKIQFSDGFMSYFGPDL